jgi:hypothetical protein
MESGNKEAHKTETGTEMLLVVLSKLQGRFAPPPQEPPYAPLCRVSNKLLLMHLESLLSLEGFFKYLFRGRKRQHHRRLPTMWESTVTDNPDSLPDKMEGVQFDNTSSAIAHLDESIGQGLGEITKTIIETNENVKSLLTIRRRDSGMGNSFVSIPNPNVRHPQVVNCPQNA